MTKMMSVLLGLALLAMGILGIIGMVPMFQTDPNYVNIGEIVLGILALTVGVYSKQGAGRYQQRKDTSQQEKKIDR